MIVKVFSLYITCNKTDPVTCPLAASYTFFFNFLNSLTLTENLQGLQSGRFYLVSVMVGVGGIRFWDLLSDFTVAIETKCDPRSSLLRMLRSLDVQLFTDVSG